MGAVEIELWYQFQTKAEGVFLGIGIEDEMAISTVRFTLGDQNTFEDICVITDVLKKITEKLRKNDVKKDIKCNFEYKK